MGLKQSNKKALMSNNRRSRRKRTIYGPANQENRNDRVISAFRVMDREDSLKIAATVEGLDWNDDILEYQKVPKTHRAFILDPRIVNRHFKTGFEKGYSFARALAATRKNGKDCEGCVSDAAIGDITISGRKHVFAEVVSPVIVADTLTMKEVLGDEGLRGMRGSHARRLASPMIHLAQFKPGVIGNPEIEQDYIDALEAAFVVHSITTVTFGEVQVIDR